MTTIDQVVTDLGGGLVIELMFSMLFRNYGFKIYNVPIILISRLLVNYYFENNFFETTHDNDMEMLFYNMFLTSLLFKLFNPRSSFSFLHALFLTMFVYLARKHQFSLRVKKIRQQYFN
jgi:hypothetical protein